MGLEDDLRANLAAHDAMQAGKRDLEQLVAANLPRYQAIWAEQARGFARVARQEGVPTSTLTGLSEGLFDYRNDSPRNLRRLPKVEAYCLLDSVAITTDGRLLVHHSGYFQVESEFLDAERSCKTELLSFQTGLNPQSGFETRREEGVVLRRGYYSSEFRICVSHEGVLLQLQTRSETNDLVTLEHGLQQRFQEFLRTRDR